MERIFSVLTILFLASAPMVLAADKNYFPPSDAQGGWRNLKDPAKILRVAGMDSERLDQAFEYTSRTTQHGGLLVARHGWLVYESYFGRGNREAIPAMASVGKALASVSCGIMLGEKRELFPNGLDAKVFTEKYLPEAFPLDDPRKSDITLGELLTMAAGLHGEGGNPGMVNGEPVALQPFHSANLGQDMDAIRLPLWIAPGGGYSYASGSPHIASIVLRHAVGMEMQDYVNERLAKPLGWGRWGYAGPSPHMYGGGDCALRSTDALRFAYLLLQKGNWNGKQIVPADYVAACGKPSPYQKHAPFSLMFEVNADGHVAGAPKDAFFKSGGGSFGICIIPSLDLVIYKMGGTDHQYDPKFNNQPQNYKYDGSRGHWQPAAHTQFSDGAIGVDDGLRRVIEMVAAAVVK